MESRAPRSSSTSTRSRPTSRRSRERRRRRGDDGGRQGGRLRPRASCRRRARPGPAAPTGSASAVLEEALALRAAGDTGRILSWLAVPGEDYARRDRGRRRRHGVHGGRGRGDRRRRPALGVPARVQLKVDTGPEPRRRAPRGLAGAGRGRGRRPSRPARSGSTGVWSHFACSDEPGPPRQRRAGEGVRGRARGRRRGRARARRCGTWPTPPAALLRPSSRYDLVRCGIASYGLSPAPDVRRPPTSSGWCRR